MEYVSRKQWGAIPTQKPMRAFRKAPVGIVVHHTTGGASDPAKRVRGHDRYHVHTRGWTTIAYNWLVSGDTGEVFEGRGWHVGGATRGWNSKTVAISYIGSGDDLTEKGKAAIRTVVDEIRRKYGGNLWIKCHRDFKKTYCPSDTLAKWIKEGMQEEVQNPQSVDWDGIVKYLVDVGAKVLSQRPLRKGSRGKYVSMVQSRLNERTGAGLVVDGAYGRKTKREVAKFQSKYSIKVDGTVGPTTWRYLWVV